jgi:hypothetical protein
MAGWAGEEAIQHEVLRIAIVSARSWKLFAGNQSPTTYTMRNWGHLREFLVQHAKGTDKRTRRADRLAQRNRAAQRPALVRRLAGALVDRLRSDEPTSKMEVLIHVAEQVFVLRRQQREVADQLGVNPGTISRHLAEVRPVLRQHDADARRVRGEGSREGYEALLLADALRDRATVRELEQEAKDMESGAVRTATTQKEQRAAGAAVARERDAAKQLIADRLLADEQLRARVREPALAASVAALVGNPDEMELVTVLASKRRNPGRRTYGLDGVIDDESGDVSPVMHWRRKDVPAAKVA